MIMLLIDISFVECE